jgi:hypothetical protein
MIKLSIDLSINMFLKVSIRFFLILFSNFIYSQSLRLIGSIYDKETNQPIPYANIAVRNMPVGTCTNFYGDFVLNLPDSLSKGRLDISCIGFQSCSFLIDSLILSDTLSIGLMPKKYQLADIVIIPGENDVATIMKKVISRIDNNYSGKKYYLEAFFRHRVFNHMKNDNTVRLTEAAISIHQDHTSNESKKVQVNEIRNSNNYTELSESVGQKLLYNVLGGDQNPVYKSMFVERLAQKKSLKRLTKSENFSASLNGVSFFDDILVYIIDFKQVSWEFLFKKYNTTHTYTKYRYYINAKDFAIIKAESIYISHNPELRPFVKNDSIAGYDFIQFRKFDEKYYPAYVYFYGMIADMVSKNDKENFYNHEAELMVNEIATRRKDYERIKSRNAVRENKALWNLDFEYNPSFWESYNVLLEHPLNTQYKNDLEFEKPLNEQFNKKENAKIRN